MYIYIYIYNGYHHWKWIWRTEFKSWINLFVFHKGLILMAKVCIRHFSLQQWVNSRADWFFKHGMATSLGEGKLWIQSLKLHLKKLNKTAGEEARRQLRKNAASNLEQVLATTPHKTPTVRPPASYHENYSS